MLLTEYDTKTVSCRPPSRAVQDTLDKQLGDRLQLLWLTGDRLRVTSRAWVGVVRLPDGTSIRIVPKLAGDELRVLHMLALTTGAPPIDIRALPRDLSTDSDGDLLDLLCALLCHATEAVLTAGPLRDYRDDRNDLSILRGNLDVRRQALAHYGRVDVLACQFQEFDHDVLENRLLRQSISCAKNVAQSSRIRRRASVLLDELAALAPGICPTAEDCRQQLQYDRRNEYYRSAHIWALALLENQRIVRPFDDDGNSATVFLLDMNRLFEAFLTWLVSITIASAAIQVLPQPRDRSLLWCNAKPWGAVIPDLLISTESGRLAVDAKYKRYDLKAISAADLYQLFLYAQAYRGFGSIPVAVMIYPSESPRPSATISLDPGRGTTAVVRSVALELATVVQGIAAGGLVREQTLAGVRDDLGAAFGLETHIFRRGEKASLDRRPGRGSTPGANRGGRSD